MANSSLQPLILHAAPRGPNPWKVAIILKELDIPYKTVIYDFPDLKKEPFITFNPNGRAPALQDPNTGVTLGEVPIKLSTLSRQSPDIPSPEPSSNTSSKPTIKATSSTTQPRRRNTNAINGCTSRCPDKGLTSGSSPGSSFSMRRKCHPLRSAMPMRSSAFSA